MTRQNILNQPYTGLAATLSPRHRTQKQLLQVLAHDPRVSQYDMEENAWLVDLLRELYKAGLVTAVLDQYPWHRYTLTEAGKANVRGPMS